MTKHTPGPWTIDTDGGIEDCEWHGWDINGKTKQRGGELDTICMVLATENTRSEYTMTAEDEANARLIVFAPELLEALEALLAEKGKEVNADGLEPGEESHGWTRFADCDPSGNWDRAKQAIAKAKGEPQ